MSPPQRANRPVVMANLFETADPPAEGERFERLHEGGGVVIERIVSSGNAPPEKYLQDHDEWVTLLSGAASLDVGERRLELRSGDHVFLPAGTPHAVVATTPGALWLAVHLAPRRGRAKVKKAPARSGKRESG